MSFRCLIASLRLAGIFLCQGGFKTGARVTSSVQEVESSDFLIDLLHFNVVVEFDTGNEIGQVVNASESVPALLGALSQLDHHV